MQKLWISQLTWDEPVPEGIVHEWNSIWSTILDLEEIRIPRWFGTNDDVQLQIHGFADSSKLAYGCGIYLRVEQLNGHISCNLIASKSKVAPIKKITIPKLELAAAGLLSKFFVVVRDPMELKNVPYFLWSDSTTTLQWIRKPIYALKVFVANRVKAIQESTNIENWRYVNTADNPADLVRGLSAKEIVSNDLWRHGPPWLLKPQEQWPLPLDANKLPLSTGMQAELRVQTVSVISNGLTIYVKNMKEKVLLINYKHNLQKLTRILGYALRFVRNCRNKTRTKPFKRITRSRKEDIQEQMRDAMTVSSACVTVLNLKTI